MFSTELTVRIGNPQIHVRQSAEFREASVNTSQQSTDTSERVRMIAEMNLWDLKYRDALHSFLTNTIITNCWDSSSLWLRLTTWEAMVFFVIMIGEYVNRWVSSSALREYVAIHKIDKLLCVNCVEYTSWLIHEHSMDVPRTQYRLSADIIQAFCRHGVDDIYVTYHTAIHWLRNGLPRNLTDFCNLLVTRTILYRNFIPAWKEYRFCP